MPRENLNSLSFPGPKVKERSPNLCEEFFRDVGVSLSIVLKTKIVLFCSRFIYLSIILQDNLIFQLNALSCRFLQNYRFQFGVRSLSSRPSPFRRVFFFDFQKAYRTLCQFK